MLDGMSVRIAFGVMALTFYALLCLMASSTERSTYISWWRRAMPALLIAFGLFALDGTRVQRFTNPVGDVATVAGVAMVWAGARTLRGIRPPVWALVVGPLASFVCAVTNHPERSAWAGGWCFLASTGVYFGLCAFDTWKAGRSAAEGASDRTFEVLIRALAIAFGLTGAFYVARAVTIVALGPGSHVFRQWFGSGVTSLVHMFLLTTVAFSLSSLVTEQKVRDLQRRASRDMLTGLLNRGEFLSVAQTRLAQTTRQANIVVLADLDRFKAINDRYGHAAGDEVIRAFAQACTGVLRAGDLISRFGGEEFVLFLPGATPGDAERLTRLITSRFQILTDLPGCSPTASYGLAATEGDTDLLQLIERADQALYRAKESGRDRAAHFIAAAS